MQALRSRESEDVELLRAMEGQSSASHTLQRALFWIRRDCRGRDPLPSLSIRMIEQRCRLAWGLIPRTGPEIAAKNGHGPLYLVVARPKNDVEVTFNGRLTIASARRVVRLLLTVAQVPGSAAARFVQVADRA